MASNLGELLLREKVLSADQLKSALDFQKKNSLPVGTSLVQLGYLTEEDIAQALSRQLGYPYIDLDQFDVYPEVISLIPVDVAKKYMVMPIHRIRSFLTLAMVDPTDLEIIEDIRFRTGLSIQPVIASETGVANAINKYYGTADAIRVKKIIEDIALADDGRVNIIEDDKETDVLDDAEEGAEEAPIIKLVNQTFIDAIKRGASDVHFEPYETSFRVRYRMDGDLYEIVSLPLKYRSPVISRVKILSNMDIAEKRLPQDGRIKMRLRLDNGKKKEVDMRISSLPTLWGEKIVARILDKEMLKLDLTQLGFEEESLAVFTEAIHKPWGIVLVTGPTGSGKTNTLYSAISTIHTNDAASSITRMENMNVEPFLIADSLILVVAQRLIRRLCKKCAQPQPLPEAALLEMGYRKDELKGLQVLKPGGCDACNKTGYKGRTALFEVMRIDDDIRVMILTRAQSRDINKKAMEKGMLTLRRSGLVKIKNGVTSIEEVLRETVRDE